jgi:hypothetical protein
MRGGVGNPRPPLIFLVGGIQAAIPLVIAKYMWPREEPLSGVMVGQEGRSG